MARAKKAPPSAPRKTSTLYLACEPAFHARILRAAAQAGVKVPDFQRSALVAAVSNRPFRDVLADFKRSTGLA